MKFLIKLIPILLVTANYRYTHCEIVFRQVVEEYDVSSIYTAGNLLRTCVKDSTGAKLTEVSNDYYSYGLTNTSASGVNGASVIHRMLSVVERFDF